MYTVQLDSATSLIQAAKNLMNAVVLAVKASYVASTKYTRAGAGVSISVPLLGARFTKYVTTILRLSYDNAKVTIDLQRTTNFQNIIQGMKRFS